jgi:hypothetical protein
MAQYFFKVTNEERENILDKHKSVYNGYATNQSVDNIQPLYVQDFANDKNGITINNKGSISQYKNMNINEENISLGKYSDEDEDEERKKRFERLPNLGSVKGDHNVIPKSWWKDDEESEDDSEYESENKEQYEKVNYLGTDMDEGILDIFGKKNKGSDKTPYTAEAVQKIIKMIKNAKTEEHLKSLMQMVDNLLKTNNDVNDAYKERINIAFRRKTDELGNYLSKKEFDKIMGGIDRDVKYGDESEEIKESIAKSIDWFKKLLK